MKSGNTIVPSTGIKYFIQLLVVFGVALGLANLATMLILKRAFISESVLGSLLALINSMSSRWIEHFALRRNKSDFVQFLLVFSLARFTILFAMLVFIAWQTQMNKSALFLAFMIEYLILSMYHIANIKIGVKGATLSRG